ncbi:MAG: hypothetical protein M1816_007075 [Peltula sp. TS41687]|nr:MAG: hypothetical protein M1816_007075 [Peltula sp. TS41687]
MLRNNVSSSLQKTYDECYLTCSTAVYYESQNNEVEALRSWRSALDQIYYHNAYRLPANYRPKTETEKVLLESLRDMELQCKERVDLLEALQRSRHEANKRSGTSSTDVSAHMSNGNAAFDKNANNRVWLGEGTVPAVTYTDLARSTPPPLPQRPAMAPLPTRKSATEVPKSQGSQSSSLKPSPGGPSTLTLPVLPPKQKTSRSPSPEKKTGFLTTLRNGGKDGKRTSRSPLPFRNRKESGPAAAKAATQAWGTLSRSAGDRVAQRLGENDTRRSSLEDSQRGFGSDARDEDRSGPRKDGAGNGSSSLTVPVRDGRPDEDRGRVGAAQSSQSSREPLNTGQRKSYESSTRSVRSSRSPVKSGSNGTYEWPTFHRTGQGHGPPPNSPKRPNVMDTKWSQPTPSRSSGSQQDKSTSEIARRPIANSSTPRAGRTSNRPNRGLSSSGEEDARQQREEPLLAGDVPPSPTTSGGSRSRSSTGQSTEAKTWKDRKEHLNKNLPAGVDAQAAKQILNEIIVQGDEVHWDDVAGLDVAKNALKEAVVYPFLRPDLFMGLREPARGMLLFGPPGTGKTMLARAVATESKSTFFSISASSLTSKYLGESEKLVRALFVLAKALAPSIIFVDEIDSLLSSRSGAGEHEATRRIKTEFLIQWSDLARAAAGREPQTAADKEKSDASRVLVLAATNLPWAIDEAARRRFVRRQYIPLPEGPVRAKQFRTLLGHQKHELTDEDIERLVELTDGFSGSDITALAKDAAMGPLRSLGEALLYMSMDQIRPIQLKDFQASLITIRPSVSKQGLEAYENWAREFGERGG